MKPILTNYPSESKLNYVNSKILSLKFFTIAFRVSFVHAFAIHRIVLYVEFYVLFHIARKVRNGGNEVTDRVSWFIGWLASIGIMSPISSHFLAVQVIVQQE